MQEVTGGNFGVVMITQSAWESFEDDSAGTIPLSLHIHPNQPSQIIDLVSEECPPDDDESLFQNFVSGVHNLVYGEKIDFASLELLFLNNEGYA